MRRILWTRTPSGFGTVIRRLCRVRVFAAATAAHLSRASDFVNSSALVADPRYKDRRPPSPVLNEESNSGKGSPVAKKPIIINETEARQATEEGVVRYILLASITLVVVLFVIAYVFFH
jgi:hypothetical protein